MPDKFTTRRSYQNGILDRILKKRNIEKLSDLPRETRQDLERQVVAKWAEQLNNDEIRRCLLHFFSDLGILEQKAIAALVRIKHYES